MPSRLRTIYHLVFFCAVSVWIAGAATREPAAAQQRPATAPTQGVMPRYDANRNLLLPDDYRQWVLVGSALGLSYSEVGRGS